MTILQELENAIRPILDDMNLELVELQYNRSKRSSVRIFVWEPGGVTLEHCTIASRRISDVLDQRDLVPGRYNLEVSSPGLTRPLKTQRDFERSIGEKLKAVVAEEEKHSKVSGKLIAVTDDGITLEMPETTTTYKLAEIVSAKIVVEI